MRPTHSRASLDTAVRKRGARQRGKESREEGGGATDSVFVSLRRTTAAAASETAIRLTAIRYDDNPR
ncbi:hypothetical protein KQX54_019741 [Cotesia glomerata]|uniref:Uncharacterized protein n=1 Tax=Cotesia glomerata TaxID=32391 RepID=A0AAV7I0R0_COTGL|nr:hypothetical protein KQX54_019741 [Cotesia glomerata]